jgi:hypothetical protein
MAGTGTAGNVTISNYSLFLEWGWETNRLKAGAITVQNSGRIRHVWNTATVNPWTPNAGIFIECASLDLQAGGEINGAGLGYGSAPAAYSNGYGFGRGMTASGYGGGAGYGGAGGAGSGGGAGGTYGSSSNPTNPGSGGASGYNIGASGGGGYLKLVAAGTVTVNGLITMNGVDALWDSGGGSGGGILIQCGSLVGSGTIRANGGSGSGAGGGGGGGRIALTVLNAPFHTGGNVIYSPTVSGGAAGGGGGATAGGAGTIYRNLGKSRGTVWSIW